MITYSYWAITIALSFAAIYFFATKLDSWKGAAISALVIIGVSWAAHTFYFQQIFVKRWGGVMTITVPEGQYHLQATWKDDNLWVENYDPVKNECLFTEYSKGNILQGKVTVKRCNPLK